MDLKQSEWSKVIGNEDDPTLRLSMEIVYGAEDPLLKKSNITMFLVLG